MISDGLRPPREFAAVLTEIITNMGNKTRLAYPGPTTLARSTGYIYGGVRNI